CGVLPEEQHDRGHEVEAGSEHCEDDRGGKDRVSTIAVGHQSPRNCSRRRRCRPASSKLAGSSHWSNATFAAGHSRSSIENQAVSRLRPLTIMCWRKTPSNFMPNRSAARLEGVLSLLHFHSKRR